MKIHHLELEGFGPFRGKESVSFEAFDDDGMFLITGRTGAGKTSILDAVTYALFGRVPRYGKENAAAVRSDHLAPEDSCAVTLDFTVAAGRFKVTRSPEYMRPKARGTGLTKQASDFKLARFEDGEFKVIEDKLGNAEVRIGELIALSAEQFQQVVLLAQGQFQEFLVADSEKRQELLSRLFSTRRFSEYSDDLQNQARVLGESLKKVTTQVAVHVDSLAQQCQTTVPADVDKTTGTGVLDWAAALVEAQQTVVAAATATAQEASAAHEAARTAHAHADDLQRRRARLDRATARHLALVAEAEEVAQIDARVRAGRRAKAADGVVRAAQTRAAELLVAGEVVDRARDTLQQTWGEVPEWSDDPAEAQSQADLLGVELASVVEALEAEKKVAALDAAAELASQEITAHDEAGLKRSVEQSEVAAALAEAKEALVRTRAGVDEGMETPAALEAARAGLKAAQEESAAHAELLDAQAAQLARGAEEGAAATVLQELRARRYAEYAGVLAAELMDGSPCLVCGATEHPVKAEVAEPVLESDIDAAEQEVTRARARQRTADELVTTLTIRLAAAREVSLGEPVQAWQTKTDEATAVVKQWKALRADVTRLEQELALLEQKERTLSDAAQTAQQVRADLLVKLSQTREAATAARAQAEAGRGEFDDVISRRDHLEARRQAVLGLAEALRTLAHARSAEVKAVADRDEVLTVEGFDSPQQVAEALVEPAQLAAWEKQVETHRAALLAVTSELAAPELQEIPDEVVEIEPLAQALTEAERARDTALAEQGSATQMLTTVTDTSAHISQALAASQELRIEYATVNRLASTLRGQSPNTMGMALESFALAAELEEIVVAANGRLRRMTQNRFEFQHTDARVKKAGKAGLGLAVLDAHTGEARSPKSLSGGEKFQASLALALGLAEVVTARAGGVRLDTLFIDEGFGTLDPETLEATMATLDSLREGGRTVGLISHVAALKESIPAQLRVEVEAGGWSTVKQQ